MNVQFILDHLLLFSLLGIWSFVWKAIALWKAGRNNHFAWFIALFVINTLGILEIIYIFGFANNKRSYDSSKV